VFTLLTGSTLAQAIPVLISPVLTRIYRLNDFGLYALFTSIVLVTSCLSTCRYEQAILLPKDEAEAIPLLIITSGISVLAGFAILGIVVVFNNSLTSLLKLAEISNWLYIFPFSVFLNGLGLGVLYWATRKKYFKQITYGRISQSVTTAAVNLLLGFAGIGGGLIIGFIAGQGMLAGILAVQILNKDRVVFKAITRDSVKRQMLRYINFPKFSVFSAFIESAASQMHILLFSVYFGSTIVGYLALTQRVIRMPMTLVANSVAEVFKQRAGYYFAHQGNCKDFFVKTSKMLFMVSVLPFVIIIPAAPPLFAFLFGAEWRIAGEYAQLLGIMFFLQFTVSPVSSMFVIAEKQKYDLFIQMGLFTATAIALSSGYYMFNSGKVAITLFAVVYSSKYVIEFLMAYDFSKEKTVQSL